MEKLMGNDMACCGTPPSSLHATLAPEYRLSLIPKDSAAAHKLTRYAAAVGVPAFAVTRKQLFFAYIIACTCLTFVNTSIDPELRIKGT